MSATVPRLGRGMARAALAIAAVTVAARAVGLLRQVVLAHTVGPTYLGNTYQTANALPTILFEVAAGGALAGLVIPVLAAAHERGDRETVGRIVGGLLTWAVVLLTPVMLVGLLARRPLMSALVGDVADPALRAAEIEVGGRMLLVFLPQVLLYGVGIVVTGVLQMHRRFLAPALAPLLSSVVVIVAYLLYAARAPVNQSLSELSRAEELTLSVGTTLGVVALTLPLLWPLRRLRLHVRPTLRLPVGVGRQVRALAAAGAAAVAAQQGALLVVLYLANPEAGAVIVYQLAFTAYLLPWAVLAVPIATSAFPELASRAAAQDVAGFGQAAAAASRAVVVGSLAATALLLAVAAPAARLLLGSQGGGTANPTDLAAAIATFAPGLAGYALVTLVSRALYARGETRFPALMTVLGFAVVAVADVVLVSALRASDLSPGWTVAALGAGNTLGMTVAGCALVAGLRARAGRGAVAGLGRSAAAAAAAALVAASLGASLSHVLGGTSTLASLATLLTAGLVASIAFVGVAHALGLPELALARRLLPVRFRA